jgi:hypothetical protein
VFLLGVVFCRRCTTTVGASTTAGAGVLAGCDALGCGGLVVEVFVGCWAVPVLTVPGVDAAEVVVVVTGTLEPSPGDGEFAGVSAPSAPPASGPPKPAAVSPLPASADSIARHALLRVRVIGYLRQSWSLCCPIFVVGAASPRSGGTPTEIHIGRQAETRKGFVIALQYRRFRTCHRKQSGRTVPAHEAERPILAKLSDFGQIYR